MLFFICRVTYYFRTLSVTFYVMCYSNLSPLVSPYSRYENARTRDPKYSSNYLGGVNPFSGRTALLRTHAGPKKEAMVDSI